MYIQRAYDLEKLIKKNRVLIIYGARRVGKTTLVKEFLNKTSYKYKFDTGDNILLKELFEKADLKKIKEYCEGYQLIAIDEAQYINNIGKALKIIVDYVDDIYVIATGSSSFDLINKTGEPLTGRKRTILLYPFSLSEVYGVYNRYELKERIEDFLIFGMYPEVVLAKDRQEKIEILQELVNSYLLKDILSFEKMKSSTLLLDLLRLLSFQVGQLVSLSELAVNLHVDVKTVKRYLDLLQKSFIIRKVEGFGRNLRKEISSKSKYYFIDNGIRNAVIMNFNPLNLRDDVGGLWENFIVMEKIKKATYARIPALYYFWRTYSGEEIDLVEVSDGKIHAFEMKYTPKHTKIPKSWQKYYSDAEFDVIHADNFTDFLL
ncbi:ATP-binding protein [Hippea jasoniae]|uniref:ATP-binding protein n=1 Tax=Hippea jasoniae TaxID=944479 RepID=UPI000557676C|nr:ATP-binding protein [Hippea jasoniae]